MKKIHAKSPCCRGEFIRFGSRRRQCVICRGTWRVRKKKRGRKRFRGKPLLIQKYFKKSVGTIHGYADERKKSDDAMQRRFSRGLDHYLNHTPWEFPSSDEPLIAIADAMWHESEEIACTAYFILLRPVSSTRAWILPPVIVPGKEDGIGWRIAFEEVPDQLKKQIIALVCDGKQGLRGAALRNGWLIQLCQFHLISSIKNYATGHPGTKWYERGKIILDNLHIALTTPNKEKLEDALENLRFVADVITHKALARIIRWFLVQHGRYRTYLDHPHLNLPTTTNSAEALNGMVRELLGRSRGFRSAKSLTNWIRAFCLHQKTITCNGKLSTKLTR